MLNNKHKQLYTLIAFIVVIVVIGAFYYFSQIKEGARSKSSSNVEPKKITGERNSKKNTSKIDILKKKIGPS